MGKPFKEAYGEVNVKILLITLHIYI